MQLHRVLSTRGGKVVSLGLHQKSRRLRCHAVASGTELVTVSGANVSLGSGTGQQRVLHNASLRVEPGALHMLVGPNGCGKSTLLKLIGGLLPAESGDVAVDGPCAFVFQNPDHQVVMPTVAAEVALGMRTTKLPQKELCAQVEHYLRKVRLWDLAEASTGTLSGGQKQRLAIAAALAQGPPAPKVLLLDELTTFLDSEDASNVLDVVREVVSQERGVAAIWVTHRLEELPRAHTATYMEDGRVQRTGSPAQILRHLKFLGAAV